jgi:formylglycine-generating enzyme required for sulfatase activity
VKRHLLLFAALAPACADAPPPRDQWLVTIATDAPPPPFFDRVVVEVVGDDGELACGSSCRRVFGFTDASTWPLSFGITGIARPLHLRARIYRSSHAGDDGLPLPPMLIDAAGRLPPARGVTPVGLELRMSCFGVAPDLPLGRACDPGTGELADEALLVPPTGVPPTMGTWPPGRPAPCDFEVPTGMVCVPGGVFFLGGLLGGSPLARVAHPEHLVQLSPYALDVDEMNVGTVRSLAASGAISVLPRTRDFRGIAPDSACTWVGVLSADNDALPANCLSRAAAEAVCVALGKRLPTEAELEWAAGNLSLETEFPWGGDSDVCNHAVVARDRIDYFSAGVATCRVNGSTGITPWGPVAGGDPRDVTALGVRNLGGNVREWAADRSYSTYDDPCWGSIIELQINPRCDAPMRRTTSNVARGGSWDSFAIASRAIARVVEEVDSSYPAAERPSVGFRCARPKD